MRQVTALVLAAGEGKRMKSDKAKVLHKVCGKAMIEWVCDAARGAGVGKCVVIVGYKAEQVMEYMGDKVEYVLQEQRLGTGHAVRQAARYYSGGEGRVLVLCGDTPLISANTIKNAAEIMETENLKAVIITAEVENPDGYGRIVRDCSGRFVKIVEHRDASENEKKIKEINSGMYIFSSKELAESIELLKNDNDQKEYYLTDVPGIMISKGYKVGTYKVPDSEEILGVNDQAQLGLVSAILEKKLKETSTTG